MRSGGKSKYHFWPVGRGLMLLFGLLASHPVVAFSDSVWTTEILGKPTEIAVKKEPAMEFFYRTYTLSSEELEKRSRAIAVKTASDAIRRAHVRINGPLTFIFQDLERMSDDAITANIGFPISGSGNHVDKYQQQRQPEFKCLSLELEEQVEDEEAVWTALYLTAIENGLTVSGQSRTLIKMRFGGYNIEYQLGIQ